MLSRYSTRQGTALVACLALSLLAASAAQAVTVKVGPSAGSPGSACQFRNPQLAIDSLPNDGQRHTIELESGRYAGVDATIDVDGRQVTVVTRYNRGSNCASLSSVPADLIANQTSLEGGRTVVVRNGGSLMLESVNVLGNQRGGLLVRNSSLDIRSGIVANHSTPAGSSGAGIVIEGGFLTIENSRINGNAAGANGGAVFCARGANVSSSVIVRGQSRILQNTAIRGGGIYQFQGCSLQINEGVLLEDNTADLDGGAIGTDPGTVALEERNVLVLSGTVSFLGNIAGRDGGAISLAGFNTMESRPLSMARFTDNQAGRHGGAIDIANSGAQGGLRAAQFLLNDAGVRGGAISVGGGIMSLVADCAAGNTVDEDYCAFFEENQVLNEGSLPRSGGSLSLHGGILSIDGFAFRNSIGPSTVTSDSGGVIAFIDSGFLRVANSLVYDNPQVTSTIQHLFQLNGGRAEFSFNTMVDLVAGSVLFSQPGATAEFVGNIIAGNNAGITGDGDISGTCNNVQLGGDAVPVDPRFVTTAAGRYRLAEDSPMIGLGLSCRNSSLPAGYGFPQKDLDGNARVVAGEEERQVDLGAFEYTLDADVVFANGFEAQPVN